MNEYIVPVNNEALSRALVAVAGKKKAAQITKAYQAIDAAMAFGHAQGIKAAPTKDEETSFKAGHDAGYAAGYETANSEWNDTWSTSYDDGYVDGVSDARSNPSYADEVVADLCAEDEVGGDWYHDWDPIPDYEPKVNAHVEGEEYFSGEPRDKTVYDEPVTKSFLG